MTEIKADVDVAADGTMAANTEAGERILEHPHAEPPLPTDPPEVVGRVFGLGESVGNIAVRRGGIAYSVGGWCAPSGDTYDLFNSKPLTKKQWRERAERAEKALRKERSRSVKKDHRIAKLLRIIERLG